MSDLVLFLAAIPVGLLGLGAFWLFGKLLEPAFGLEARGRRLARRRERRLARGTDSYFEELRAIDSQIESQAREAARPRRHWLRLPLVVLLPFFVVSLGVFLLDGAMRLLDLGTPPFWFRYAVQATFLLVGLRFLLDPDTVGYDDSRIARLTGAFFVGMSVLILVLNFSQFIPE